MGIESSEIASASSFFRTFWTILVLCAFGAIIAVSLLLQQKFQESLLSTVVESTNYAISEISFPAVTLCNNHRVNFDKFDQAVDRFLPNASQETRDTFLIFLQAVEVLDFGSFDELEHLIRRDVTELNTLPLKEVVAFVGGDQCVLVSHSPDPFPDELRVS